jgi:hypothetical protein
MRLQHRLVSFVTTVSDAAPFGTEAVMPTAQLHRGVPTSARISLAIGPAMAFLSSLCEHCLRRLL